MWIRSGLIGGSLSSEAKGTPDTFHFYVFYSYIILTKRIREAECVY